MNGQGAPAWSTGEAAGAAAWHSRSKARARAPWATTSPRSMSVASRASAFLRCRSAISTVDGVTTRPAVPCSPSFARPPSATPARRARTQARPLARQARARRKVDPARARRCAQGAGSAGARPGPRPGGRMVVPSRRGRARPHGALRALSGGRRRRRAGAARCSPSRDHPPIGRVAVRDDRVGIGDADRRQARVRSGLVRVLGRRAHSRREVRRRALRRPQWKHPSRIDGPTCPASDRPTRGPSIRTPAHKDPRPVHSNTFAFAAALCLAACLPECARASPEHDAVLYLDAQVLPKKAVVCSARIAGYTARFEPAFRSWLARNKENVASGEAFLRPSRANQGPFRARHPGPRGQHGPAVERGAVAHAARQLRGLAGLPERGRMTPPVLAPMVERRTGS